MKSSNRLRLVIDDTEARNCVSAEPETAENQAGLRGCDIDRASSAKGYDLRAGSAVVGQHQGRAMPTNGCGCKRDLQGA